MSEEPLDHAVAEEEASGRFDEAAVNTGWDSTRRYVTSKLFQSLSLILLLGIETRPVFTHARFLQFMVNFIVADDQV
jgi:hypothetical protein